MSLFFTGPSVGPEAPSLVRTAFGTPADATARDVGRVRVLRLPGVYAPEHDTHLLLDTVLAAESLEGARVLDLCTGTGRVAVGAALAGAAEVTAVDISRRAVLAARLNSALHRARVRALRSDMLAAVSDRQFDVVLTNPPYVPAPGGPPGRHSRARAWDAGPDGRELLDRICTEAPLRLAPGGRLWIVQSALSRPDRTVEMLADAGLDAEIAARADVPFGPVLTSRAAWLRAQRLIGPDSETECLVVIRGRRP